jgi:hypothetical protein
VCGVLAALKLSVVQCNSQFGLYTKLEEWTNLTGSKVIELYVACIYVTKFTLKRSMSYFV